MNKSLFASSDLPFARALSELSQTNPFLKRRIELEREALGPAFREQALFWVPDAGAAELNASQFERPNLKALGERALAVASRTRQRFAALSRSPDERDLALYQDVCLYALLYKYDDKLFGLSRNAGARSKALSWYPRFAEDYHAWLSIDGVRWPIESSPESSLAFLFQLRRAFHFVFRHILGTSPVSAELRADTWRSIFTHDLRRYQTSLFQRMHDIVTLITGPTGSGKELVAQAIGLSRYVPFDPKRRAFADAFASQYHALHLAALPISLIESELFGHRRGAFTGAVDDRVGWLESCGPSGTIFLDEIGELPAEVQVKLLRAIQARTFNRLGESSARSFLGKLVAATHRDLTLEMNEGRFRPDLYHRLSADRIRTPGLFERLQSDPGELAYLVELLSRRVAGEQNASAVAQETIAFVEAELGSEYPWPGNVRELEQCVRGVLLRGRYEPPRALGATRANMDRELLSSGWSLKQLEAHYARLVYQQSGSYSEAARRLGIDRRTLKQHVTDGLAEEGAPASS